MKSIPVRSWALSLLAAMLQIVPFPIAGPVPLWRRLFCWFCLVPLLDALVSRDRSGNPLRPWQGALLSYLTGIAWFAGNCYWVYQTMHIYGGIPELPSFGILILFSLYLGLFFAFFGWAITTLRVRFTSHIALFAAPFLWVAIELARARITGFSWDALGYTQVDNSLLTALAPLGGVMLLSFVVTVPNTLFALGISIGKRRSRWSYLLGGFALAALFQAGSAYDPPADPADHVATLLQENLSVGAEGRELTPFPMQEKYRQFTQWSLHPLSPSLNAGRQLQLKPQTSADSRISDLIIWPEAPADFLTSDPTFRAELGSLARAAQAPVIAGSLGVDLDPAALRGYRDYGSAAIFGAGGNFIGRYDKIHRVPFGEYVPYAPLFGPFAGKLTSLVGDMQPGAEHSVFRLEGHSVGVFICYESIFGNDVRQFVRNGAEVLVNISDDGWYGDTGAPWQHLDMARMRAIENRRWLLRDTNTGITTAIDPHGRGLFSTPRHVRSAFAFFFGFRSDTTFYTRHGDWFAWLCALVSIGLLGFAFIGRSKQLN